MTETAREQILRSIARITREGSALFSPRDEIHDLRSHGSQLADSTIRTHVISRMCANSPDHHGTTYADLERVSRGTYRLRLTN